MFQLGQQRLFSATLNLVCFTPDSVAKLGFFEERILWQKSIAPKMRPTSSVTAIQGVIQRDIELMTVSPANFFINLVCEAEIFQSTREKTFIGTIRHERSADGIFSRDSG